jgi:hypothetical protein
MTGFPRITSPCPLRFRALPEPGRDWCRFCEKRVHNLDLLSEDERAALLARGDAICVAYTLKRAASVALAGAGVAATLAGAQPARAEYEVSVTSKPRESVVQGGIARVLPDPQPMGESVAAIGGILAFGLEPFFDAEKAERALRGGLAEFREPPRRGARRDR